MIIVKVFMRVKNGAGRTHVVADVQRLGHPVVRDRRPGAVEDAVDVLGRVAALDVDVAGQSSLMARVSDQEDTLDGGRLGARDLRQGIIRCFGALGVALEDEALGGVLGERGADLAEDLGVVSIFIGFILRIIRCELVDVHPRCQICCSGRCPQGRRYHTIFS